MSHSLGDLSSIFLVYIVQSSFHTFWVLTSLQTLCHYVAYIHAQFNLELFLRANPFSRWMRISKPTLFHAGWECLITEPTLFHASHNHFATNPSLFHVGHKCLIIEPTLFHARCNHTSSLERALFHVGQ